MKQGKILYIPKNVVPLLFNSFATIFFTSLNKCDSKQGTQNSKESAKKICVLQVHYLTCVQLRNSYSICCQLNRKVCVDPDGISLGYVVLRNDPLADEMDCSK
jgi:hypothetical protein